MLSTLVCPNVVVIIAIIIMTFITATTYIQYVNKYSHLTNETWLQYLQSHPQGNFIKFTTM